MDKNYKYITTTLPYLNSVPHIGHCFEFVIADVIAGYYRLTRNVVFNVGVDEHGQKVYQKAIDEGFNNTQEYCDALTLKWKDFCKLLNIDYDNFYRTSSQQHKDNVLKYYNEILQYIISKEYVGKYCVGCEAFVTEKQQDYFLNRCSIHNTELVTIKEVNKFFDLSKFNYLIKDVLVDKSKSAELVNIIKDDFELSITRQNVKWGIRTGDDFEVFYVWFEALLNYIFAIKYYEDKEYFNNYWSDSLIICGKDNLKFQAYILQALLLANNVSQTSEVLVHGNIVDENGHKLSKSAGNVIDPVEQVGKYSSDVLRYYLTYGTNNVTTDSKYSEAELVLKWNNEVVNGLGNLISRLLHLIDLKQVVIDWDSVSIEVKAVIDDNVKNINYNFEKYDFKFIDELLNSIIFKLNRRITIEKPFDKDCENYAQILNEIYFELKALIPYYKIVLKEHADLLDLAFQVNKKTIIFTKI